MLELALWLKKNGFRAESGSGIPALADATATAMYHSGKNPLRRITRASEEVVIPKGSKCAVCTSFPEVSRCRKLAAAARGAENAWAAQI